jgi:hypothetical protein
MRKSKDEMLRFFAPLRMTLVCVRMGVAAVCLLAYCGAKSEAQQSIGTVGIADATVAGALEVSNGRAMLMGASTVTARDHTAEIELKRGGSVKVCSTSGLHITAGKGVIDTPLLLALDRGAIEVAARATTTDVLMTPDLRFTLKSAGVLDLRMRVARNGDTCVENRGAAAPALSVADQFGETSYELHAGQHVLFEHGSLKEVVDNESEPCGCPAEPVISVADAGVAGGTPAAPGTIVGNNVAAKAAAEQHPFPAAVSAGLAPSSALPPQTPAGQVHAQVSTTMSYGEGSNASGVSAGGDTGSASTTTKDAARTTASAKPKDSSPATADTAPETTSRAQAPPPPPAPSTGNVFHSIGRFFKKLFRGH